MTHYEKRQAILNGIKAELKPFAVCKLELNEEYGSVKLHLPKRITMEDVVADRLERTGWKRTDRRLDYGGYSGAVTMERAGVRISVSGHHTAASKGCSIMVLNDAMPV